MRNLRKRRKLIRKMEQANKIPDKLMPQEIKDMLDVSGFRPVIGNTPNSAEIKINSGRSNALRCLAVVAAFVLVVGGFAVLRFSNTQFVKKYPNSASSQSADASGLDGLRGTTYKGLYNYINSNSKNIEDFIVDYSYIFKNIDALTVDDDDYVALYKQALRDHQLTPNPADIQLTRSGVDITPTTSVNELETNITYGNAHFITDNGGIDVYITKNGNITKSEQDIFADTFLKKGLVDIAEYEQYGCKFAPSVVAMYLDNNELYAFFDFILPVKSGKKNLDIEYCGMCVFDVSDPENIKLISEFEQPGVLEGIRKVDGKIFIVSRYTRAASLLLDDQKPEDIAPVRYINGEKQLFEESEMYITARDNTPSMILLSSFDGKNQGSYMASKLIACGESSILMGTDNIYILRTYGFEKTDDYSTVPTRALITRINYGGGDMELNKTQTVTGADAEHISHAISGDEYNGRLSLFSNDSANIYDISTHNIYYSGINICTLWLFDNDLGGPVKKTLTYEDTDFESARYSTFYHSMLYVYREYSFAYSMDDTYQAANNIQLDEVYDFSDPNKITQVPPDDKMIAVSTANNFFHYGTNYNDDIAVRTDSTSFDSFSVKIFDKSKTEKQETLLYGSSGKGIANANGTVDQVQVYDTEVVKKFNFFKTIQEYKYHEKEMGTTVDGKDMTQRSASTISSNSIITDNENGYIAIPLYDVTSVGKTTNGYDLDYTYYNKTIEKMLVMKYDIETKTFSEYGTIKLDEYTDYFDDYFDHANEDEITAMVNDNDQRDYYQSAFVQDGYIYIFSDRQIRSYSYDDLSKPVDSVDIVK
ncbi:hypothetical protein [Ruminococcus sp.]